MIIRILITNFVVFFVFVNVVATAFAYSQILGKKDAKGQLKKEQVEVTVGTIEEVKPGKINIKTNNKNVEINTNQNTKIIGKPSDKKLNTGQLKKNDQIATFESDGIEATGTPDLIIVKQATSSAKLEKKRRAVYGLVRDISGNRLTISHPIKNNPRYTLEVTKDTYIKIKGIEEATIADIKIGDRLTGVGNWVDDVLVVKRIHVIPGKAIGLYEKIATMSASPTATPSASPIATPSAIPSP